MMNWKCAAAGRPIVRRIGAEKMTGFERFIALPDPVLTQWFSQDETPSEPEFAELIAAMRAFHGLGQSPAGMREESE